MDFCESCIKEILKISPEKSKSAGNTSTSTVDVEKIKSLKNAGWTAADIADDL